MLNLGGWRFPTIVDIDSDGDLDIFTLGSEVYYIQNQCMETTAGITPTFENTDLAMAISPVPAKNNITIQIPNTIESAYNFSVTDVLGKTVLTLTLRNNTSSIDVSTFKRGIYFARLSDSNGHVCVNRVLIE